MLQTLLLSRFLAGLARGPWACPGCKVPIGRPPPWEVRIVGYTAPPAGPGQPRETPQESPTSILPLFIMMVGSRGYPPGYAPGYPPTNTPRREDLVRPISSYLSRISALPYLFLGGMGVYPSRPIVRFDIINILSQVQDRGPGMGRGGGSRGNPGGYPGGSPWGTKGRPDPTPNRHLYQSGARNPKLHSDQAASKPKPCAWEGEEMIGNMLQIQCILPQTRDRERGGGHGYLWGVRYPGGYPGGTLGYPGGIPSVAQAPNKSASVCPWVEEAESEFRSHDFLPKLIFGNRDHLPEIL